MQIFVVVVVVLLCCCCCCQDPDKQHEGHGLFYEFHRNQSGSPDNVLLHALGQWRISPAFHDLCFLPDIAVRSEWLGRGEGRSEWGGGGGGGRKGVEGGVGEE